MRDRIKLFAKGGDGGSGCFSIRRSRRDSRGQPDGISPFHVMSIIVIVIPCHVYGSVAFFASSRNARIFVNRGDAKLGW